MEEKNYGLNIKREYCERSPEDWKLGGNNITTGLGDPVAGLVTAGFAWPNYNAEGVYPRVENRFNHCFIFYNADIKQYFPEGERQFSAEDYMDCVARGHINEIEKQLNYIVRERLISTKLIEWLKEKGYFIDGKIVLSNRIPAIGSNTTRSGNSVRSPIDWIKDHGIHPRTMLPEDGEMTWAQYHDKSNMTKEILDVGLELKEMLPINYLVVYAKDFHDYSGATIWEIFDNYIDKFDGDWVKRLAANYKLLSYGYKILINEVVKKKPQEETEKMILYKRPNESEIYQKGEGDGLYHHIIDEPVFRGLYKDFSAVEIKEIDITDSEIGFKIMNEQSLLQILTNLFKGK